MKKYISLIMLLLIPSLMSCVNHRNNYFVEGHFQGINSYAENETYFLNVNTISKKKYESSSGINVVQDLVNPGYYSLDFYYFNSENEKISYDFVNLRDAYNGATGTNISYVDDNEIWLSPFSTDNDRHEDNYDFCYYSVHISKSVKDIYVYLFICEEEKI